MKAAKSEIVEKCATCINVSILVFPMRMWQRKLNSTLGSFQHNCRVANQPLHESYRESTPKEDVPRSNSDQNCIYS
jgi:hypothetical protein